VTDHQIESWVEGTSEDLVADALALGVEKASARMVTDWVEAGLLASPEVRKTTRHGSDPRVFSAEQRRLFTELLRIRERSPLKRVPHRTVVRPVLYLWLIDDTVVPTEQARRAWRTYARASGLQTASGRLENARKVIGQIAHPEASYRQRRIAQLLLEDGEKTKQPDWGKLTAVLTDLCSPWPAMPGVPRIERAMGVPEYPVTAQHFLVMWQVHQQVTRRLFTEEIDCGVLDTVRAAHRPQWAAYQSHQRPAMQACGGLLAQFATEPATLEGQIKEAVDAFVSTLAGELGLIERTAKAVEAARVAKAH